MGPLLQLIQVPLDVKLTASENSNVVTFSVRMVDDLH